MTLLIDADWLLYSSCCSCEQDIKWDDNLHTLHADERDVHEMIDGRVAYYQTIACLLYTSPSPRDRTRSRMPSSA